MSELSAAERYEDGSVEKVPWYRVRRSEPGEHLDLRTLFHEVVYETGSRVTVSCGRVLDRDPTTECYWEKYPGHWPEEQSCRDCMTIVRSRRLALPAVRVPGCSCSSAVLATGDHDARCPSLQEDPVA